ncbi:MAG: cache domain-containing protein [Treponema sp.]|nr:cache domain-containing protein [Treponema sp.]
MTSGQKVAFSLLISVLVSCAFTVLAFSGLFDLLEVNFYQPLVQEIKQKKLQELEDAQTEYFDILIKRFDAFTQDSSVKTYLETRPAVSAQKSRDQKRAELMTATPALKGLRIIDNNGRNVYFSTYSSDLISGKKGIEYRNYDKSGELSYESVRADDIPSDVSENPKKCRIIKDGNKNSLIFSLPFYTRDSTFKGTVLFYCDATNFSQFLFNKNLIDINGFATLITEKSDPKELFDGFGGFVFGLPNFGDSSIREQLISKWREDEDYDFWKLVPIDQTENEKKLESKTLCAFSAKNPREDIGFITLLYDESDLSFPPYMRLLLLVTAFFTFYLAIFLILSFKHDDIVIIRDKVRRYENEFFAVYKKMGKNDSAYLIEQKPVLERRILKSLGKKGAKHAAEFKSVFESCWQELSASFAGNSPSTYAQISRTEAVPAINADELKQIVRSSLEDILENGKLQINAASVVTTSSLESGKKAVQSEEKTKYENEVLHESPAEELDEVEENAETEPAEEVDEIEEIAEAESAEEVDEVEEIAEAEPAEELDEVEEIAEAEPAEEVDEVEEIAEAEPAEELDEVEEIAEAEPAEEIDEVEEIAEAEPAEELDEVEEIEESEPAEELDEVEEIAEAEPAEEVDEIEEITEAEPAEELDEVEEIAEAEPAEELDEVEEIAEAEPAEEVDEIEEVEEAEPAEELDEVEEIAEAEPAEELDEVEEIAEAEDEFDETEDYSIGDKTSSADADDDGAGDDFEIVDEKEMSDDLVRTLRALPERGPRWDDVDELELDSDGLTRKLSAAESLTIEKLKDAAKSIEEIDNNLEELESFVPSSEEEVPVSEVDASYYIPHLFDNNVSPDDDIYKDEYLLEKIEFGVPTSEVVDDDADDSVAENFVATAPDYSFLDEDDSDDEMYGIAPARDITKSEHFYRNLNLIDEEKTEQGERSENHGEISESFEEAKVSGEIDEIEGEESAEDEDDAEELEALEEPEENMPFMFTKFADNANAEVSELTPELPDAIEEDSDGTFHVTSAFQSVDSLTLNMEFKKLVDSILR